MSVPGGDSVHDFDKRLQEAMRRARGAVQAGGESPDAGTAAPPDDPFRARLTKLSQGQRPEGGPSVAAQADPRTGPVGQGEFVVSDGDCISSIAKSHGFFWETLWNEPNNAELRQARRNPNVLLPGDRVTVPEKRRKDEDLAPEQRHRFKRKGEPSKIRFQLLRSPSDFLLDDADSQQDMNDQPWPNVPYRIKIDDLTFEGTADSAGFVECLIPGNAQAGLMIVNPGQSDERKIDLMLGGLSPISEPRGVSQRLENLGFECGSEIPGESNPMLRSAIGLFQEQHGLPVTGKPDQPTRDKLVQVYGS